MLLTALAPFVTSCSEDTAGVTGITYYPTLDVLGDASVVLYVGDTYVEQGCTAQLDGEDVSGQVIIDTSALNTNAIGIYNVSYIIYNADGFSTTATRTVYVADATAIANLYFGEVASPTKHYYDSPIYITDNGDGTYQIDDIIGGYQFNGVNAGFEPAYDLHAEGNIRINADGTVEQVGETGSWYFGDNGLVANITSGTFDADTRTFSLIVNYDGTELNVTLRPITK